MQRKATTSYSKHTEANYTQLKKAFLDNVTTTVTMEEILQELILNWDQTGITMLILDDGETGRKVGGDGWR